MAATTADVENVPPDTGVEGSDFPASTKGKGQRKAQARGVVSGPKTGVGADGTVADAVLSPLDGTSRMEPPAPAIQNAAQRTRSDAPGPTSKDRAGKGRKGRGGRSRGGIPAAVNDNGMEHPPSDAGNAFMHYGYGGQHMDPSAGKHGIGGPSAGPQGPRPGQMMGNMGPQQMMGPPQMAFQPQPPEMMQHMQRNMGMMHPSGMPHPGAMPPGMMQMPAGYVNINGMNMPPGAVPAPMMMMALHQVMAQTPGPQHPGHQQHPPMQPNFQAGPPPQMAAAVHPHPPPHGGGQAAPQHGHGGGSGGMMHGHAHGMHGQQHHGTHHNGGHGHTTSRYHQGGQHQYGGGGGKGFAAHRKGQHHSMAVRASLEMRNEDLLRASSPMLTRILVDMLREGEEGNTRAWQFFERLCALSKADVYQHSVMLNACSNSWAAEQLMRRMEGANVKPSEVTYQKLYKIYLRDARVEEAEQVLEKMRALMYADGAAGLPDDYTNRVLTDMLLEMVKEGNQSEKRAWELFNRLRGTDKVNVIHYNVMLNTCKTTQQAVQLVQQARKAGIQPSERTCLKMAKMYIKEGNMPSHPGQLEAVMKGLKKTTLFAGHGAAGQTAELDCTPLSPRDQSAEGGGREGEAGAARGRVEQTEEEVVRLLQDLLINDQLEGGEEATPPIPIGCSPPQE